MTENELTAIVARERAEGRRFSFANGCFDLIHVGHVRYLAGAAEQADRLIVAINDDAMVRQLKGSNRPIVPATERAEIVAAFAAVDYVVVFSEATVARLLRTLQPDVHCKGPDYTVESVPEREVVKAYGGRTAIIGAAKDHSTRDIVARLAAGPSPATGLRQPSSSADR